MSPRCPMSHRREAQSQRRRGLIVHLLLAGVVVGDAVLPVLARAHELLVAFLRARLSLIGCILDQGYSQQACWPYSRQASQRYGQYVNRRGPYAIKLACCRTHQSQRERKGTQRSTCNSERGCKRDLLQEFGQAGAVRDQRVIVGRRAVACVVVSNAETHCLARAATRQKKQDNIVLPTPLLRQKLRLRSLPLCRAH